MLPDPTDRLRFRAMRASDLDDVAALLGDPRVMTYYPAPKNRDEAAAWIDANQRRYAADGHGLWIIETHDGAFVGDCGLTWQRVGGERKLEVGYHVRADLQGRGYATEAAVACRDLAVTATDAVELVAIVHPDNAASRRVAERVGMTDVGLDRDSAPSRRLLGMSLAARRTPQAFLTEYARLTDAHDLRRLAPLIAADATYWFTDGSHTGRDEILRAIALTFDTIPDEDYVITDIEWVAASLDLAVARYRFSWRGTVHGEAAEGARRGTNVMMRRAGSWVMTHEHLST
ncbi:GNAT family N-acetyltransferase [Microbacterium marinilacus]|uniref:GNAT family N-acetyltransferase n=1 Tax=Microbacterium marinilacus TaxID=415209 RepID=UPI001C8EB100|nr:GNAT family N-acetyltransferase [Microbacterium marinilacus]MBY0688737.1 GNAT family N-acetyltransferase [Microbacterium marinilacus]